MTDREAQDSACKLGYLSPTLCPTRTRLVEGGYEWAFVQCVNTKQELHVSQRDENRMGWEIGTT